jgi:hypothetical protein
MTERSRRWWLGACGLDCGKCPIHLRSEEELLYWRQQSVDPDKIRCDGCRSDRKGCHWSPECKVLQCCVYDRGFDFCAECPDLPCDILKEFAKIADHHVGAVEQLIEMKDRGVEQWLREHGL